MTAQDMSAALDMADMASVEDMPARDMPTPVDMPATTDMADMSAGEDMPDDEDMLALDMADMTSPCVHETRGDDVTVICDGSELLLIHETPDGLFELGADVTLPPNWRPVPEFTGHFDGKGHRIIGINLEQAIPESSECEGNFLYSGGFIDTMSGGTLENVFFDGISGGVDISPLQFTLVNGDDECEVHYGGVIGRISNKTSEPLLEHVYVSNVNVWVEERFGSVVARMNDATLRDVHVLGAKGTNELHSERGFTGGIAHWVIDSTFQRVSAQVTIRHTTGQVFNFVGLIVGRATGVNWSGVVARGAIVSSEPTAPFVYSVGGVGGVFAPNPGEQEQLLDCAVEPFDANPLISANINSVGGVWGRVVLLDVEQAVNTTRFDLKRCRVGVFGMPDNTTLKIHGESPVGGLVGGVANKEPLDLFFEDTFIQGQVRAVADGSCHVGEVREDARVEIIGGGPVRAESSAGDVRCDGYDVLDASANALPLGWSRLADGRYVVTAVEDFFGPLRDQTAPPEEVWSLDL